jgi:hypothetical protein
MVRDYENKLHKSMMFVLYDIINLFLD